MLPLLLLFALAARLLGEGGALTKKCLLDCKWR